MAPPAVLRCWILTSTARGRHDRHRHRSCPLRRDLLTASTATSAARPPTGPDTGAAPPGDEVPEALDAPPASADRDPGQRAGGDRVAMTLVVSQNPLVNVDAQGGGDRRVRSRCRRSPSRWRSPRPSGRPRETVTTSSHRLPESTTGRSIVIYTVKNLRDVRDAAPDAGVDATQVMRFAQGDLDAVRTGVSLMAVKPGRRQAIAHRHDEAEEVDVIVSGSGRIKLDDDIVEVGPMDAIRVAPTVTRALEGGPDGIEYLAVGQHHDGDGRSSRSRSSGPSVTTMSTSRVVQVTAPGQGLAARRARDPSTRPRRGPRPHRGLRRLPLRLAHGRGRDAVHRVPDRARARDRRAHRGRRRGRRPVGGRPAGRCRLVRRELRALRPVPPRRHDQLRQRPGPGDRLRRRLRRPRGRPGGRPGVDPGRPVRRGGRAAALRRHHHVQRVARERRAAGRPRRHPRDRRSRPSRRAVRAPHGLRDRGRRPRDRQARPGAGAGRPPLHRLHRRATSRLRCRTSAARRRSSPR